MNKKSNVQRYNILLAFAIFGVVALAAFAVLSATSFIGVASATSSGAVGGNVVVPKYCAVIPSNSVMNFAGDDLQSSSYDVAPGQSSDANIITLSDTQGNDAATLTISANNWVGLSNDNNFYVTNTIYAAEPGVTTTSDSSGPSGAVKVSSGVALTSSATSVVTTSAATFYVGVGNAGSNSIWFEVSIPDAQSADSYNQIITMDMSCV